MANFTPVPVKSAFHGAGYWEMYVTNGSARAGFQAFKAAVAGSGGHGARKGNPAVRLPSVNHQSWNRMIHGVPRGVLGRLARLGGAAQLALLSLLGASAVLLELL